MPFPAVLADVPAGTCSVGTILTCVELIPRGNEGEEVVSSSAGTTAPVNPTASE